MATSISGGIGKEKAKRKRVVHRKARGDKLLDKTVICDKFGIGRSTVGDIKKNRKKILNFKKETESMGMKHEAKTMKLGRNVNLDKALHVWFCQKRMEGVPVSGPILCEKAKQLHKELQIEQPFVASEGWKWRFCKRHGMRNLSLEGEMLSADQSAADATFSRFVMEENLCLD